MKRNIATNNVEVQILKTIKRKQNRFLSLLIILEIHLFYVRTKIYDEMGNILTIVGSLYEFLISIYAVRIVSW